MVQGVLVTGSSSHMEDRSSDNVPNAVLVIGTLRLGGGSRGSRRVTWARRI